MGSKQKNFCIMGKALQISKNALWMVRGDCVFLVDTRIRHIKKVANIKQWKYAWTSRFFLLRRLLRAEVTGLYTMKDGSEIVVAKKGLYRKRVGSNHYELCFAMPRGSKPLNLCLLPNGNVFFGEYFQNMQKQAVNIYGSKDNGESWQVVYTFKEGSINHVHGVFYDKYTERIWVLTGDRESECIIGYTEDEFTSFHDVFRGGQEYRSCLLFFYPSFIVFATDSQYIKNEVRYFDRNTLEIKTLTQIQGSAIKGGQVGDVSYLSTTVEPSKVNKDQTAHIWMTKDGLHWKEIYSAKKDWWPAILQFGTFEFPQYLSPIMNKFYFSGRALTGCDGKTICIDITD